MNAAFNTSLYIMATEVSICIAKILNWPHSTTNTRLEVSFYTLTNHTYLAHKTTLAYYNHQTLVLNTSFRINYSSNQHKIICKISDLSNQTSPKIVGEIEIDITLLAQRKLLFLPFDDHDKVLEVKLYEQRREQLDSEPANQDHLEQKRDEFLRERFDFLDRVTDHEAQLKKAFSEKVYNLLKDLKSKGNDGKGEHVHQRQNKKNQADYRNNMEHKHKFEPRKEGFIESKARLSPPKFKYDHELLIHSMHNKPENKADILADCNDQRIRVEKDRHSALKDKDRIGINFNPAFGLNPYHNQFGY